MRAWVQQMPVTLETSAGQWQRLARDWFFSTGIVEPIDAEPGGTGARMRFTWGESDFERVRELVAWLGPPARLVAPAAWVPRLRQVLAAHAEAQFEDPA